MKKMKTQVKGKASQGVEGGRQCLEKNLKKLKLNEHFVGEV